MRSWNVGLVVALAVAGAIVGCGGNDSDQGSTFEPGPGDDAGGAGGAGGVTDGAIFDSPSELGFDAPANDGDGASASCGTVGASYSAACASCLGQSCCAPAAQCSGNAECAALVSCIAACGTVSTSDPCVQGCAGQHGNGLGDYNGLVVCLGNGCHPACPY